MNFRDRWAMADAWVRSAEGGCLGASVSLLIGVAWAVLGATALCGAWLSGIRVGSSSALACVLASLAIGALLALRPRLWTLLIAVAAPAALAVSGLLFHFAWVLLAVVGIAFAMTAMFMVLGVTATVRRRGGPS